MLKQVLGATQFASSGMRISNLLSNSRALMVKLRQSSCLFVRLSVHLALFNAKMFAMTDKKSLGYFSLEELAYAKVP